MKGTADFHATQRVSMALDDPASVNGALIDCLGFSEALPFILASQLGGSDPTVDVKWQEAANLVDTPADIAGAVHSRLLYDDNKIVTVVNLTNIALAIAAQPAAPSRISATVVDTTPGITVGDVTIVGTRAPLVHELGIGAKPPYDQPLTEVLSFTGAATKRTTGIFKSITSVTASSFATLGGSGDETIKVGVDNSSYLCPHVGRINLVNRKRYLRAVMTAGGSATGGIVVGLLLLNPHNKPSQQLIPREFSIQ